MNKIIYQINEIITRLDDSELNNGIQIADKEFIQNYLNNAVQLVDRPEKTIDYCLDIVKTCIEFLRFKYDFTTSQIIYTTMLDKLYKDLVEYI